MTVGEAAKLWLERGTGPRGRWEEETRERYERVVRQCIDSSPDPGKRPLVAQKLRDVTADSVADWCRMNERALAPTHALRSLLAKLKTPAARREVVLAPA